MSAPPSLQQPLSELKEEALHSLLHSQFGFQKFRPRQLEIIQHILKEGRVLSIQPTGYGKSLLYQLPAAILPGITVVISPLLALMRDQIHHLKQRFQIPAAAINSDQTEEENEAARQAATKRNLQILFVAPEQLDNIERFHFLLSLPISFIVVDEAHCISTWGHDFRPSYRQIIQFIQAAEKNSPDLKVLGLTATANQKTEQDIKQQLSLQKELRVIRESMDRPNLSLDVCQTPSPAEKLARCVELLRQLKGTGIIYCATRENTILVADYLQKQEIYCTAYHAGLPPEVKRRRQQEFLEDKYQVLTATNALGMGIDKPNVRYIIHFDIPGSITAYYQEVGRAGRDGLPAQGILLYHPADLRIQHHFIESAQPSPDDFAKILREVQQCKTPPNLSTIKRLTGLHPTRVTVVIAELIEQGFLAKTTNSQRQQVYTHTHKQGSPDLTRYERQLLIKKRELKNMTDYAHQKQTCRLSILREALGDRFPKPCQRCSCCDPSKFHHEEKLSKVEEIKKWLLERPVTIEALVTYRTEPGIAVLDGTQHTPTFVNFMKHRASSTKENWRISEELLSLVLKHLSLLKSQYSVIGIVPIPSRTWGARDFLLSHLSQQLGVTTFPDLLRWQSTPERRQGELLNNDQRKYNVDKKMTISKRLHIPAQGALILFDDYAGSRNTMREATRALRREANIQHPIVPFTIASIKWHMGKPGFV